MRLAIAADGRHGATDAPPERTAKPQPCPSIQHGRAFARTLMPCQFGSLEHERGKLVIASRRCGEAIQRFRTSAGAGPLDCSGRAASQ
jgi:hypothetical protein